MLGLVDPKKWLSSAGDKISDVVRSPDTAKKVSDLEDKYAEHRRSQKLEEGTLRGVRETEVEHLVAM